MDKILNSCNYCHKYDTIAIEKVRPSESMSDGKTITFKCKDCGKRFRWLPTDDYFEIQIK